MNFVVSHKSDYYCLFLYSISIINLMPTYESSLAISIYNQRSESYDPATGNAISATGALLLSLYCSHPTIIHSCNHVLQITV